MPTISQLRPHSVCHILQLCFSSANACSLRCDRPYSGRTLQLMSICARLDQSFQHAKTLLERIQ